MKKLILLLAGVTTGCEVAVVESPYYYHGHESGHYHEEVCAVEPFYHPPEQCWYLWDAYGNYDGECCEWDVGDGHFEDWCLWQHECDWQWEYTGHYTDVHHHDTPHYH